MLVNASALNLSDSRTPYTTTLEIGLALPGPRLAPAPPQYAKLDINLYVTAEPIAARATLDDPGVMEVVVGDALPARSYRFTAHDFEGLPLSHDAGEQYNATCGKSCGATHSYDGNGVHKVHVTLKALGDFNVSVWMTPAAGDGGGPGPLPFMKHVQGACPRRQYSAWPRLTNCQTCPLGSTCALEQDPAATGWKLSTLELEPNRWRLSNLSAEIHNCTDGLEDPKLSPCRGGPFADQCTNGTTGPLCQVCEERWHYFKKTAGGCLRCHVHGGWAVAAVVSAGISVLLLVIGLGVGVRILLRHQAVRMHLSEARRRGTELEVLYNAVRAKAKLVIGFYQVVEAVPGVYGISLPPSYFGVMRALNWLNLNWMTSLSLILGDTTACLGGFATRLSLQALLPLVLLLILLGLAVGFWRHTEAALKCEQLWRLALIFLFVFTPGVSREIFSAFNCKGFVYSETDDVNGPLTYYFLNADYSLRCSYSSYVNEAYEHIRGLAVGFILLWPLGVPILFTCVIMRDGSQLGHAVNFLTREYKMQWCWWEVLLLLEKVLLTGFILVIPDSFAFVRVVVALVVCIAHLALLLAVAPYREASTAAAAVGIHVALVGVFLTALLLKVYDEITDTQQLALFGTTNDPGLVTLLLVCNFAVLLTTVGLLLARVAAHRAKDVRLRYITGDAVLLRPIGGEGGGGGRGRRSGREPPAPSYHLFLSHVWVR